MFSHLLSENTISNTIPPQAVVSFRRVKSEERNVQMDFGPLVIDIMHKYNRFDTDDMRYEYFQDLLGVKRSWKHCF